jgi:hypothetical protein
MVFAPNMTQVFTLFISEYGNYQYCLVIEVLT